MLKADGDTQFNMNKKRGIALEKKEARHEKEEAEKYQRMKEQLVRFLSDHTQGRMQKFFLGYTSYEDISHYCGDLGNF